MAAGLGFKNFTSGDVLTAADVNGYLNSQTIMVFADTAARTAAITSPQEGMFSYLKDTNATEYYTGAAWVASGGGGKVLQVINAIYTTGTTSTTSAFADTGLTASITPSSATSKVLVFITLSVYKDTNDTASRFKILRGATEIAQLTNAGYTASGGAVDVGTVAINYLDSPATTSATTYKAQFASVQNNSRIIINDNRFSAFNNSSSITLMEIGA